MIVCVFFFVVVNYINILSETNLAFHISIYVCGVHTYTSIFIYLYLYLYISIGDDVLSFFYITGFNVPGISTLLSIKDQMLNIFSFVGHMSSVATL